MTLESFRGVMNVNRLRFLAALCCGLMVAGLVPVVARVAQADTDLLAADPFEEAVTGNYGDKVHAELVRGASPNKSDFQGRPYLLLAAQYGASDSVRMLLEFGARPQIGDKDGNTPLHRAAGGGYTDIIDMLIKAGATIDAVNREGLTPLMMAVTQQQPDAVKDLLDAGADVMIADYAGRTAFDIAHGGRNRAIERMIKQAGG
ncbi:ankyrin repeat domain-containing protein [Radicibacter daui]|uniref:ankyrin repeat domain-containing protein n=1 Tax=Radicibacter daui TaxID=3064829 RepID=UPI0040469331